MNKDEINTLHDKFSEYGRNAKHWLRQCQMLLPKIRDEEVWSKKGFASIYEYAAKLAGMSHNSVNEALRVYDALQDKPILKGEVEKHGTHKVKTILTVATQDTQEFWLKKLNEMSKSTLETYVRGYKKNLQNGLPGEGQRAPSQDCNMSNGGVLVGGGGMGDEAGDGTVRNKQTASIYMKLDVKTIERMKKLKGDMNWDEMLNEMLNVYEKVVDMAQKDEIEKPAPVNTGKRYVPKKIKKYVTKQTSGLCAYPGCSKPYEILHHTERFALNPTHDPDTLRPLCKAHERLAHGGLIEGEEKSPVEFVGGGDGDGCVVKAVDGDDLEEKAEIKVNWSLRTEPDISSPKYATDKKVNEYYMSKPK